VNHHGPARLVNVSWAAATGASSRRATAATRAGGSLTSER